MSTPEPFAVVLTTLDGMSFCIKTDRLYPELHIPFADRAPLALSEPATQNVFVSRYTVRKFVVEQPYSCPMRYSEVKPYEYMDLTAEDYQLLRGMKVSI